MNENSKSLWVVVGDIHDDCRRLAEIPELEEAAGIIVSGDITFDGGVEAADRVMGQIAALGKTVYAQIGNMDKPEVTPWLAEKGWNLHAEVRWLSPSVTVFGIGGSTVTPFNTPSEFTEEEYGAWLSDAWAKAEQSEAAVLISHNPPRDTACDFIPGPNIHVGSQAVRDFIEFAQPALCICGHIHEAKAQEKLGATTVVNPGTLADGGYVLLHLNGGDVRAELKQLP